MRFAPAPLVVMLALGLAAPATAQTSGDFVVRLGRDTTGAEHYERRGGHLEVDQVGRSPRVLQRHFAWDFAADGALTHVRADVIAPGAPAGAPPLQRIEASFTRDSMMMEVGRDTSIQRVRLAVPAGTVVIASSSPWSAYEQQSQRLLAGKADSLRATLYFLGAPQLSWIAVRRLGRDSVVIETEHDLFHARVDRGGRLLNVVPLRGTGKFTVDRVEHLDLAAQVAAFVAEERQAGTMGALSTRDTVRANVAGAELWIDYGRPAKRGRAVFGGVVPWGEVWRTGANAATQFRTDHALSFGGTALPAGMYTLWSIPSPGGWKLVINRQTGQWGTEHDAKQDLATIDMQVSALPQPVERFTIGVGSSPAGGTLDLDWDTTRASVAFTVQP